MEVVGLLLLLLSFAGVTSGAGSDTSDNRLALCLMARKYGVTIVTPMEAVTVIKCVEPTAFKDPEDTDGIKNAIVSCAVSSLASKAPAAMALYGNAQSCIAPDTVDTLITEYKEPALNVTDNLSGTILARLKKCKTTCKKTGLAKQEFCLQQTYALVKAIATIKYMDLTCKKFVKEYVKPAHWKCVQKFLPQVANMTTLKSWFKCPSIKK